MQVDSERRRSALALLHMATNVKHTTERAWHLRGVTTIVGVVAIALATPLPAAAQKWPAAEWQVAVIATTDNVHEDGGEATLDDAEATLIAGGDDIWNNADQFTFLYKEISGDFDVAVVVQSIEFTNEWAKAGIMARQTLEPGSINVLAPRARRTTSSHSSGATRRTAPARASASRRMGPRSPLESASSRRVTSSAATGARVPPGAAIQSRRTGRRPLRRLSWSCPIRTTWGLR